MINRRKKQPESEEEPGAPEWMVTFSDCMTLLLTFFVLLLSFSSFDENFLYRLKVIFAREFTSLKVTRTNKEAFLATKSVGYTQKIEKGSEKPTLEKNVEENLIKDTESVDFHKKKVFLTSSDKIFWGRGTVISLQGRKSLSDIASFLKEVPNRIVISENEKRVQKSGKRLGLRRAWAVMEYLTTKQGLDSRRFSIAAGTLQENSQSSQQAYSGVKAERMLEIVLLERSIYN